VRVMELDEFISQIPSFSDKSHSEKIKIFGWYLHTYKQRERFDQDTLRGCYDNVHLPRPSNINPYLKQLVEKRHPDLLKDRMSYRLEARTRVALDTSYGEVKQRIPVSRLLTELPRKIPILAEKVFLEEAIVCYKEGAFRAAIVMTWNLAFDHLLEWILCDASHLGKFNARISVRFPKQAGLAITRKEDFEEFKESEIISIMNSSGLFSKNIGKILEEKLARRNITAHPSAIVVTQHQAEDVITDLVNNVIMRLM
jgi:hypothetical protein